MQARFLGVRNIGDALVADFDILHATGHVAPCSEVLGLSPEGAYVVRRPSTRFAYAVQLGYNAVWDAMDRGISNMSREEVERTVR